MPDSFSMTMDSRALEARLHSLTGEQQDRIMARAFRDGAEVYQAAVMGAAPERPALPSGTALSPGALKSDVIISKARSTGGPIYLVGFGKLTRHVAWWVEFGHRLVKGGYSKVTKNGKLRGPGREIGNVAAHPFFRSAFEAATPEAADVISASIVDRVNKAFVEGEQTNA